MLRFLHDGFDNVRGSPGTLDKLGPVADPETGNSVKTAGRENLFLQETTGECRILELLSASAVDRMRTRSDPRPEVKFMGYPQTTFEASVFYVPKL